MFRFVETRIESETMITKAIVFTEPGKVDIQEIEIPSPSADEVLVKVAYSCMSPGTESRVLDGTQSGAPAYPLVPGYSAAGVVERTGNSCSLQAGTPVFITGSVNTSIATCWGAHIQYAVVPASKTIPLPKSLNLKEAACSKLLAIAMHGIHLTPPAENEKVAIVGLGPIGFFSAMLHQALGTQIAVTDLDARRTSLAFEQGLPSFQSGAIAFPGGADRVVDATGAASSLASSVKLLREKPWNNDQHTTTRLIIQGSYAEPPPLPYNELFEREAQVWVPRDNQLRDLEAVLHLMHENKINLSPLIKEFGPPESAPCVYENPSKALEGAVAGVFRWS